MRLVRLFNSLTGRLGHKGSDVSLTFRGFLLALFSRMCHALPGLSGSRRLAVATVEIEPLARYRTPSDPAATCRFAAGSRPWRQKL